MCFPKGPSTVAGQGHYRRASVTPAVLNGSTGEGGALSGCHWGGAGREGAPCSVFFTQGRFAGVLPHGALHDFCYSMGSLGCKRCFAIPRFLFPCD